MIFHESDYELAFITWLEESGWQHMNGSDIPRTNFREVIYADDTEKFLSMNNPEFTPGDIHRIIERLRNFYGNDFHALHEIHTAMTNGLDKFLPEGKNIPVTVDIIDFENPDNNIFRAVNQLSVEYTDSGQIT